MAGFNDTALNVGMDAIAAAFPYLSIHTATPNSSGSNESTAARQAASWASASGGDLALSGTVSFTGGAASGPGVAIGFWSASSSGTFGGYVAATGDQTFNAAGQMNVTGITIPGSAS